MRFEPVCTLTFRPQGEVTAIRPHNGAETVEFAIATGSIEGERLSGQLRLAQRLRRSAAGSVLVEFHGLVMASDGVALVVSARGNESPDGLATLSLAFDTPDGAYAWLNALSCLGAASFDRESGESRVEVRAAVA
jgi:hypothetical protein